ncbi:hypothetical protein [Aeromicrobium sp. Leaf291]|uniref:hypothetical protein n=1 Tax=Aeromicrobium sp. Leaf291 TaxID=1736325 RepID=UPI0006FB1E8B|nr:hypothetical protein [Aeromicrobium sp. Leaf291]KQP81626.1 hypothetical protein ASF35_16475 [Aeromicrobium sp. Leaf291]
MAERMADRTAAWRAHEASRPRPPLLDEGALRRAFEAGYDQGQAAGGLSPADTARSLRRMAEEPDPLYDTREHRRAKPGRSALLEAADRVETGSLP